MIVNFGTLLLVAFRLIAISSGAIVLFGLLTGGLLEKWAVLFLRSSLAASVTGLLFSFHPFQPFTHTQGIFALSVYVVGGATVAWRKYRLAGVWCSVFALTATIVLYLNVAVAITQAFKQVSPFMALAPTHSELPFQVTQLLVLALFMVLALLVIKRFHNKRTNLS